VARRTIRVIDLVELFQHWPLRAPDRRAELVARLDRKTVRRYLTPALAAGIVPGGPPLSIEQWAALAESWFPELVDRSKRQTTWPEITPHHETHQELDRRVTIATMHQRLRDATAWGF